MSDTTTAPAAHDAGHGGDGHGHHEDHSKHYIKIWGILLVLLVASVIGPFIGEATHMQIITLLTAFGIAFVKAYLVIKHFMHLTVEKKYIGFLMLTMLAFMLVFVGGVSPGVMKHAGQRWTNDAAAAVVEKGLEEEKAGGGHGHDAHPVEENKKPADVAPPAQNPGKDDPADVKVPEPATK